MAAKLFHGHTSSGLTLYALFFDSDGNVWDGAAWGNYVGANIGDYDVALNEFGTAAIYRVTIPSFAAGRYTFVIKDQAGVSPAQSDSNVGSGEFAWDGSDVADIAQVLSHGDTNWATADPADLATAVLTNPANPLTTNASGEVAVDTTTIAAISAAVWAAGARTLTAFGFTVTETNSAAIRAVTDKLDDTLEDDVGTYRFTANALEQAPDGGTPLTAQQVADAVWDEPVASHATAGTFGEAGDPAVGAEAVMDAAVDGAEDVRDVLKGLRGFALGQWTRTATAPPTYDLYNAAGDTVIATLVFAADGSERTPA